MNRNSARSAGEARSSQPEKDNTLLYALIMIRGNEVTGCHVYGSAYGHVLDDMMCMLSCCTLHHDGCGIPSFTMHVDTMVHNMRCFARHHIMKGTVMLCVTSCRFSILRDADIRHSGFWGVSDRRMSSQTAMCMMYITSCNACHCGRHHAIVITMRCASCHHVVAWQHSVHSVHSIVS